MRVVTSAVLILTLSRTGAHGDEIHWHGVARAAQSVLAEQPEGEKPALDVLERRAKESLAALKHPTSPQELELAAPEIRARLAAAIGIGRLPKPQARSVRLVGTLDRGDYVVEKLVYETLPGCRVPAHIYRPAKPGGRLPAVLYCPGHSWAEGKSHPDTQALAVTLARWGFVVLAYDPHGEGERGISQRDHRRTELLLAGLSQQAIPTFESLCAFEYLLTRPDVDAGRVGMTGESGGGYNTWVVAALEPRVAAAVPVVGTSEFLEQVRAVRDRDFYLAREHCHFVAGLFRFANNHEFLALAAPRPVLVIAADNDNNFRLPGVRQVVAYGRDLYAAIGKPGRVGYYEDHQTGHGYQKPKRQAAYGWFRRWLQAEGTGEPIPEPGVKTVAWDAPELRRFPPAENQPAGPAIMAQVGRLVESLPAGGNPPTPAALSRSVRDRLGVELTTGEVAVRRSGRRAEGGAVLERLVWTTADGLSIPALLVALRGRANGVLLAAADGGKESLLDSAAVRAAVESGTAVVAADVRGVGELAARKSGWVFATSLMLGENPAGRQALDLADGRRALAGLPEFKGRSVGLLGSGPSMAQAALYASVLDPEFGWLVTDGGFLSFRSFLDRPRALNASYKLTPATGAVWDVIDREVPASLFVFDVLRHWDLADLYGARAARPVLAVRPADGEGRSLTEADAGRLLGAGRFHWPRQPGVAVGEDADRKVRDFVTRRGN